MNFDKKIISSLMLKGVFKEHSKIKKELLNLISKQPGESVSLNDNYYNDNISFTDWPTSENLNLPWKKYFLNHFGYVFIEMAKNLGYKDLDIKKLWFQKYKKGGYHNWHTHASNYTGVYYLNLPEGSGLTEYIDPKDQKTIFTWEAKEGNVIFFPCYLIHRGVHQSIDKDKIIISWNLDFLTIRQDLLHLK